MSGGAFEYLYIQRVGEYYPISELEDMKLQADATGFPILAAELGDVLTLIIQADKILDNMALVMRAFEW